MQLLLPSATLMEDEEEGGGSRWADSSVGVSV